MALPKVSFITSDGNLGQQNPNQDARSGLLWYADAALATAEYSSLQAVLDAATLAAVTVPDEALYAILEYFRMNPGGKLFFKLIDGDVLTAADITAYQTQAGNVMRQLGIGGEYADGDTLDESLTKIGAAAETLFTEKRPLIIIVQPDRVNHAAVVTTGPFATAGPTLTALRRWVSLLIGGDAGAEYDGSPLNANALGTALGRTAAIAVGTDIGHVATGQLSDGSAFTALHIEGEDYNAFAPADLDDIEELRVIFTRNYVNNEGAFFSHFPSLAPADSDYNHNGRNRALLKAVRLADAILTNRLNETFALNADGTIPNLYAKALEAEIGSQLTLMRTADEISNFQVQVPTDVNILSTNELQVNLRIQPLGLAKFITVTIGYAAQI